MHPLYTVDIPVIEGVGDDQPLALKPVSVGDVYSMSAAKAAAENAAQRHLSASA